MVVLIVTMERFKFGQWPGFGGSYSRRLIWGNVISSLLNKVYINSSTIRRHYGRYLIAEIYVGVRCFENGVPARTTYSWDPDVLRDSLA